MSSIGSPSDNHEVIPSDSPEWTTALEGVEYVVGAEVRWYMEAVLQKVPPRTPVHFSKLYDAALKKEAKAHQAERAAMNRVPFGSVLE
jgi:hypothetical protein